MISIRRTRTKTFLPTPNHDQPDPALFARQLVLVKVDTSGGVSLNPSPRDFAPEWPEASVSSDTEIIEERVFEVEARVGC